MTIRHPERMAGLGDTASSLLFSASLMSGITLWEGRQNYPVPSIGMIGGRSKNKSFVEGLRNGWRW